MRCPDGTGSEQKWPNRSWGAKSGATNSLLLLLSSRILSNAQVCVLCLFARLPTCWSITWLVRKLAFAAKSNLNRVCEKWGSIQRRTMLSTIEFTYQVSLSLKIDSLKLVAIVQAVSVAAAAAAAASSHQLADHLSAVVWAIKYAHDDDDDEPLDRLQVKIVSQVSCVCAFWPRSFGHLSEFAKDAASSKTTAKKSVFDLEASSFAADGEGWRTGGPDVG